MDKRLTVDTNEDQPIIIPFPAKRKSNPKKAYKSNLLCKELLKVEQEKLMTIKQLVGMEIDRFYKHLDHCKSPAKTFFDFRDFMNKLQGVAST